MRRAHHDPTLAATIVSRKALRYRTAAHPSLDRPLHVRSGSSLTWVGARLGLVQDDANFVALVDPRSGLARSITLPAGEEGLRHFDDIRGNKKYKLDLESCCTIEVSGGAMLLAFGSGSRRRRRRVVKVESISARTPRVSLIDAERLYLALERVEDFAGSDMNIEGALLVQETLRLFSRGNGEAKNGLVPVNATCELALPELLTFLADPAEAPVPEPMAVTRYELGALDGLLLGFTDAALVGDMMLYTAAAEASRDASMDGEVSGSVIGVIPKQGELRYALLTDVGGRRCTDKVEGIVGLPGVKDRVYVVIDADDPGQPSMLCEVLLGGRWSQR